MKRLAIIGIGSPFGADRLGWDALAALAAAPALAGFRPPQLILHRGERPGSGLIGCLQQAQFAILIDAVEAGGACGELYRLQADEIPASAAGLSSHDLGVAQTLALARALGVLPPTVLYGLDTGPAGVEAMLPAASMAALVQAVAGEARAYLVTEAVRFSCRR